MPLTRQYKVWIKPAAEQSFLYGNHILKNGIARMTESTPQYEGVVIFSSSDIPLVCTDSIVTGGDGQGFGATAKSTEDSRTADPAAIVVFHQADLGEVCRYLALKFLMF